ncbi:hypothetical protein HYU92_03340 [Candidatus Curtissbacteria bacterium]|nr:hypothetical protein [Candidatus Curtissbacteria bacterium]
MDDSLTLNWKSTDKIELLAHLAIATAMENNWHEALKINQKILSSEKDNVEALNRLARAYTCIGETHKAEKTYKKVLGIDPHNIIAKKNLDKVIKSNGNGHTSGKTQQANLSQIFIYEPGKTKLINLLNLAPPQVLATLNCGDELTLNPKRHAVTIATGDGNYLGALPDDLAHRLLTFIAEGNKYEVYVKCATTKILTVLIKETYRSDKFLNQPSFQANFNPSGENLN